MAMRVKQCILKGILKENKEQSEKTVENLRAFIGQNIPDMETGKEVARIVNADTEPDGEGWCVNMYMEIIDEDYAKKLEKLVEGTDISMGSRIKGAHIFPNLDV